MVPGLVTNLIDADIVKSFDELPRGEGSIPETVTTIIVEKIMDGKRAERPARLQLLQYLAREKRLPEAALVNALTPMLEMIEDIVIDAPGAEK